MADLARTGRQSIAGGLVCVFVIGSRAEAQNEVLERLGIDRLRFSALGLQIGVVQPVHIKPTTSVSVTSDYGEIAPRWRVAFTATYWGSRFRENAVRTFADSLRDVVTDPSNDDTIHLGEIRVSDIALSADVRRMLGKTNWFRPYVGGGIAAHVVNADGRLIDGTFVERAVDNIAVGLATMAGFDVMLFGHVAVGAQARFDLLSLARYGSLRVGGSYYFDRPKRPETIQ
jgi:hypothetical protein